MIDNTANEDEQWAPISDLMAALMLIFMFIAIVYIFTITPLVEEQERQRNAEDTCKRIRNKLEDLVDKFNNNQDFRGWEIDLESDLTILFRHPRALFEQGRADVSIKFKEILNSFYPDYVELIFLYARNSQDDVQEIRIEGHTSKEWGIPGESGLEKGLSQEDSDYIKNMKLSQDRAREILKYILRISQTQINEEIRKWVKDRIIANGLSSSKTADDNNGKYSAEKSRRVEFRLLTHSCQKAGIYDNN